jgi:hypothetical protein
VVETTTLLKPVNAVASVKFAKSVTDVPLNEMAPVIGVAPALNATTLVNATTKLQTKNNFFIICASLISLFGLVIG